MLLALSMASFGGISPNLYGVLTESLDSCTGGRTISLIQEVEDHLDNHGFRFSRWHARARQRVAGRVGLGLRGLGFRVAV